MGKPKTPDAGAYQPTPRDIAAGCEAARAIRIARGQDVHPQGYPTAHVDILGDNVPTEGCLNGFYGDDYHALASEIAATRKYNDGRATE